MKITVIGSGYVGLVTGICFSEFGFNVTCTDKDPEKISNLNKGIIPIYEPGLENLAISNKKNDRLNFTTDLDSSISSADVIFIAVGTPTSKKDEGRADLRYVYEVADHIANNLSGYTVVVTKSTVPVGTSNEIEKRIREKNPQAKFSVVSNPEFLREGSAVNDFMKPNRVIIGVGDEKAQAVMKELYRPLYRLETPLMFTTRQTAELIKYASNAFLATKITFINEIANLCEMVDADVQEVAKGMGLDHRIGSKFLNAGPGYGGSCFPKDTKALIQTAKYHGQKLKIVEQVDRVNEERKKLMIDKIVSAFQGVAGKTIAILGLTFKPNTDDMRDAISLYIIPELEKMGATCRIFDPQLKSEAKQYFSQATICDDAYHTMKEADGVVFLTEWSVFRGLDVTHIESLLKQGIIVDLRNIYHPNNFSDSRLTYHSVGRAIKKPIKKRATLSLFKKDKKKAAV